MGGGGGRSSNSPGSNIRAPGANEYQLRPDSRSAIDDLMERMRSRHGGGGGGGGMVAPDRPTVTRSDGGTHLGPGAGDGTGGGGMDDMMASLGARFGATYWNPNRGGWRPPGG